MQGRLSVPLSQENPLWISWHDTNWIPILNPTNVMDYFAEKSNPFYDRTCNNEMVKMQRQSLDQLNAMIGIEYILLHVQEPILYVIRKQHRHSPTDVTPLVDYYIIAGTVYQAPDLANVFNSRLLSIVHHLQTAFEEASSYSRYHPNKGYSWDFSSNKTLSEKNKSQTKKETEKTKEEPSSLFQRQRVDMLLGELLNKFPLPMPPQFQQQQQNQQQQQQHQQQQQQKQHQNQQNTASVQASANATAAAATAASGGQNGQANVGAGNNTIKVESNDASATDIKQEPLENPQSNGPNSAGTAGDGNGMEIGTDNVKIETKNEMKPPPEKKMKV